MTLPRHPRLLPAVALSLLLAACGGSSDSTSPANGGTSGDGSGNDTTGSANGGSTGTGADAGNDDPGGVTGGATGGETGSGTGAGGSGTSASSLTPLPEPPLTPAPGPDSEPVVSRDPVSTVTEFFLVRDPAPRIIDTGDALTDADFEAGPLEPVVYHLAEADSSDNNPPYFDGLGDVEAVAGQWLEVLYRPRDDDGGLPGMFPDALPDGAQFNDNYDGTKTFRWRPMQPDVGVSEFTVTAIDPADPQYRVEHTIRIRVSMPADPSTIPNIKPSLNQVRARTVRVNDPVVVYLKANDANGTTPIIEVPEAPPGATLVPHYLYPEIAILRFIPQHTGVYTITARATDAVDASLTSEYTFELEALDEAAFDHPGSRLRALASARGLLIGYASLLDFYHQPDGAIYGEVAAREFNFVSSENDLKMDRVNPLPGKYRWAAADNLVRFAHARRMAVHGHTLIWHRQLPGWVRRSAPEDREIHMREYIDRVLKRYRDDILFWDVVNEAFEEDGTYRHSTWYEGMGESYIDTAFLQARASAPNATLIYNDFDVAWFGPKADGMFEMLQGLKDRQIPIDGVGFQMHIDSDFDRFDEVAANFQRAADLDLDIYVTELDVGIVGGTDLDDQAEVYRKVLSTCLEQPRCKAFQTWGFTDLYSWIRERDPLIFDEDYQVKPAYDALQQRLSEN
ncbi:MAG: hypothetical protein CSB44_03795 [Gammaproteobacteria bacterium]|nr:MAG: hypothetical protein CSB44_03795 [Gammaproteobacteria bacterium]